MNTNNGLIIVTIVSIIIGVDTRIDVAAVVCGYIKAGMAVRFLLLFYSLLRVTEQREQVLHCDNLHSLGDRSALLVLPERDLDGHGVGKMWDKLRWDWLECVAENWEGYWSWGDGGSRRELNDFREVQATKLYSTKAYSHPIVYVYSKRLA